MSTLNSNSIACVSRIDKEAKDWSCICDCRQRDKSEGTMQLRKAIQKTKVFFHKTLKNLKSFLFGGYQKLHKATPLNHISSISNSNIPKMQQLDHFYIDFSDHLDSSDHDHKTMKRNKKKKNVIEEDACNIRSPIKLEEHSVAVNNKNEEKGEEEKKKKNMGSSRREEKRGDSCSSGTYVLAQKMKELELMDVNDVDHVLDIEEVLHYYSRLKSPAYLDIMDKFFVDTYSEFCNIPQAPSAVSSVNNSMRRLGPLKF